MKNEILAPCYRAATYYIFVIVMLLITITLFGVGSYVSAEIPISVEEVSNSSIMWNWSGHEEVNQIAIDNIWIENFNNKTPYFILNNLKGNTIHSIYVSSEEDFGENITTTLMDIPAPISKQEEFFGVLILYLILILGIIFCLVGIYVPFVGFLGMVFGIIGITTQHDTLISTFSFFILILAGIFIGFTGGKN